ncbi:hypothetical protein DID77_04545, partial [Candidatus Marinamargulisbacteria bacterium SCGC AG-439-L15]
MSLPILFIQSNSPGEISNWVHPICVEANHQKLKMQIHILLTNCPYATGNEAEIVKNFPLVSKVYSPRETRDLLFKPPYFRKKFPGAKLLFLGGDPFFAKCLAVKYR